MKRYYYKKKDNSEWVSLKSPDLDGNPDYVSITENEWAEHIEATTFVPEHQGE